jgi:hypothetical protein
MWEEWFMEISEEIKLIITRTEVHVGIFIHTATEIVTTMVSRLLNEHFTLCTHFLIGYETHE